MSCSNLKSLAEAQGPTDATASCEPVFKDRLYVLKAFFSPISIPIYLSTSPSFGGRFNYVCSGVQNETCIGAAIRITAFASTSRKYSTPTDIPVPNKSKIWGSAEEAVKDIKSGDVLMCGGMWPFLP